MSLNLTLFLSNPWGSVHPIRSRVGHPTCPCALGAFWGHVQDIVAGEERFLECHLGMEEINRIAFHLSQHPTYEWQEATEFALRTRGQEHENRTPDEFNPNLIRSNVIQALALDSDTRRLYVEILGLDFPMDDSGDVLKIIQGLVGTASPQSLAQIAKATRQYIVFNTEQEELPEGGTIAIFMRKYLGFNS